MNFISDNANVLNLAVSIITAITTIMFVIITSVQVRYSKQSIRAVEKQMLTNYQPCIIPKIVDSSMSEVFTEHGRRQLHFFYKLSNVGDSPALNIIVDSYVILANQRVSDRIIYKSLNPNFYDHLAQAASIEGEDISVHYETSQIEILESDLSKTYRRNMRRVKHNPSHPRYRYAYIMICVYYKNVPGQWFKTMLSREIFGFIPSSLDDDKPHFIEMSPPLKLKDKIVYKAHLISANFTPAKTCMISEYDLQKDLRRWKDVKMFTK